MQLLVHCLPLPLSLSLRIDARVFVFSPSLDVRTAEYSTAAAEGGSERVAKKCRTADVLLKGGGQPARSVTRDRAVEGAPVAQAERQEAQKQAKQADGRVATRARRDLRDTNSGLGEQANTSKGERRGEEGGEEEEKR